MTLQLTHEQIDALSALHEGKDVFITGGAGTGKSFLLKRFMSESEESGKVLAVVAPTGMAALQIGGVTIHKFFGGETYSENILKERNKDLLSGVDIVIIDEISMCRIDLFNTVAQLIRAENEKRSSGHKSRVQFVVCGDFYQLPPVVVKELKDKDKKIILDDEGNPLFTDHYNNLTKYYSYAGAGGHFFAFFHPLWNFEFFELTKIIRQKDPKFAEALNLIRVGNTAGFNYIEKYSRKSRIKDTITILSRNNQIKSLNDKKFRPYEKFCKTYTGITSGSFKPDDIEKRVPEHLKLAPGVRVMAIANGEGYVNGLQGTVTECKEDSVIVEFDNKKKVEVIPFTWQVQMPAYKKVNGKKEVYMEKGEYTQIPLVLAYAISYHKSQGSTIDKANLEPAGWEHGLLYTGLSRISSIKGLYLTAPLDKNQLKVDPAVTEFYEEQRSLRKQLKQIPDSVSICDQKTDSKVPEPDKSFLSMISPDVAHEFEKFLKLNFSGNSVDDMIHDLMTKYTSANSASTIVSENVTATSSLLARVKSLKQKVGII